MTVLALAVVGLYLLIAAGLVLLAHELAHVANRDAGVMTFAGVPRTLGETLIAEEGVVFYAWFFIWWLGIPIWALGSLITLTLSRYREFAADRGSAVLTGRPADMMSASSSSRVTTHRSRIATFASSRESRPSGWSRPGTRASPFFPTTRRSASVSLGSRR